MALVDYRSEDDSSLELDGFGYDGQRSTGTVTLTTDELMTANLEVEWDFEGETHTGRYEDYGTTRYGDYVSANFNQDGEWAYFGEFYYGEDEAPYVVTGELAHIDESCRNEPVGTLDFVGPGGTLSFDLADEACDGCVHWTWNDETGETCNWY